MVQPALSVHVYSYQHFDHTMITNVMIIDKNTDNAEPQSVLFGLNNTITILHV